MGGVYFTGTRAFSSSNQFSATVTLGGAAEYLFSDTQPRDEHFGQGRVDHRFSDNNNMFVRVMHDRASVDRIPPDKPPISTIVELTRNAYIIVEEQHAFSAGSLNIFRAGLNRSVSLADNRRTIDIPPSLAWIPGDPFGYLTIRGMVTEMGGDFRLPRDDKLNNWQLSDTVVLIRGAHSLRFDGQMQYLQFDQHTTSQVGGIVNFANSKACCAARPSVSTSRYRGKSIPIASIASGCSARSFRTIGGSRPGYQRISGCAT